MIKIGGLALNIETIKAHFAQFFNKMLFYCSIPLRAGTPLE